MVLIWCENKKNVDIFELFLNEKGSLVRNINSKFWLDVFKIKEFVIFIYLGYWEFWILWLIIRIIKVGEEYEIVVLKGCWLSCNIGLVFS